MQTQVTPQVKEGADTGVEAIIRYVVPGEKAVFYPTERERSYWPGEEHRVRIESMRPQAEELALERNGFVLWYKVVESREKFVWPRQADEDVVTLTVEQLNWLLDGYDVFRQPHRMLSLAYVG